jgi:ESCRT-I complex subunit VPS28
MQKMKLFSGKDRDHYDQLAELYSLILTTEQLERQYIKGNVKTQDYTRECLLLLSQLKTQQKLLNYDINNVKQFMKLYRLKCPAAESRLLIGVPSTVEHSTHVNKSTKLIAEIVQFFITLMDSIKLMIIDIDQIHPQLSDLMQALNSMEGLQPEKEKIRDWLILLNQRKASDQLQEEESRQLLFDLESAYAAFQYSLK